MTYLEAIDFLFGIRLFGQKLGLETMRHLLRLMDNPQDTLQFIHIAGTNGKGSVAAMIQCVLTEAGYTTGLYTSPHLVSFCERFQINGVPISENDVVRLVESIRPMLDRVAAHPEFRSPTFFETVTAMALRYFHEQNVDVVVWETGLGGRLDATNVVTPLVSVITNIGFDHTQYLGETLPQIAVEKCGIIKPSVPVVTACFDGESLDVIRRVCDASGSSLTVVEQAKRLRENNRQQCVALRGTARDYGMLTIPLLGAHQTSNCATAVAALEASGLEFSPAKLRSGLAKTKWPGRFQIVSRFPTVVLDGAHNADAAARLAATVRDHFPRKRIVLILGVLRDKDYAQICRHLAPLATDIYCVRVNSDRTSDPEDLATACRQNNPTASVRVAGQLAEAYEHLCRHRDAIVVITGSLFLVGEAFAQLKFPFKLVAAAPRELVLQ
jgi:dihydrofolate synthase/folylpolyglutamate synthase